MEMSSPATKAPIVMHNVHYNRGFCGWSTHFSDQNLLLSTLTGTLLATYCFLGVKLEIFFMQHIKI